MVILRDLFQEHIVLVGNTRSSEVGGSLQMIWSLGATRECVNVKFISVDRNKLRYWRDILCTSLYAVVVLPHLLQEVAAANASANSQSDDEDSAEDSDDDGVAPEPRISDPLKGVPIMMMILLGNDLPSICRSMNMPHASTRNLSMKVWRGGRGKTQNGAMVH